MSPKREREKEREREREREARAQHYQVAAWQVPGRNFSKVHT